MDQTPNRRKRRRDFDFEPTKPKRRKVPVTASPNRKRRLLDVEELEEKGRAKKPMNQLEKKLAVMGMGNQSEEDPSSLELVLKMKNLSPLTADSKIVKISKVASQIDLSKNTSVALMEQPKLDPKVVSKQVLQTLCSLGCVEKMSLMGQDFYLVLKDKLIPIFPKPAGYYFERRNQEPPPNAFASRTQPKPITIRTLVGLWLLLVQMGHFVPFPEVRALHRMFSPEVNDERLSELGQKWLSQLGVDENMLQKEEMLMDCLLERLVIALMRGRRAVKSEAERFVEPMQEVD